MYPQTITAETDYVSPSFPSPFTFISLIALQIVCDGYCPGIYKEPAETLYQNAKNLVRHLVPGTSHNLNFHKSAPETYAFILGFLDGNL